MKVTILGCGTSGGVPRIGNVWGNCDPDNPKNRRKRASVLVEQGSTRLLIDTSPDLRQQLLDANVSDISGVLYTHDHADHTHGIDDLRPIAQMMSSHVPVYGDQRTLDVLQHRFGYIFNSREGYPSICVPHVIETEPFHIDELTITPFEQDHGFITSLGFRIGNFAYSTDLKSLDERAFSVLDGVDTWVVDALRYDPHPTHSHLEQTLEWIARVKPRRAVLTHMTWDMDYDTLCRNLPKGVEPAYDGMQIQLES